MLRQFPIYDIEECLSGANSVCGCCPRMVHTTEEVSAAALANKDRLKIQKTARDFVMRVTSISGISSAACVPDGALISTRLSCLDRLLSTHGAAKRSTPCRDLCCMWQLLLGRYTRIDRILDDRSEHCAGLLRAVPGQV